MQLYTTAGPVNIMNAYAPTLTSTAETKNKFYDDFNIVVNKSIQTVIIDRRSNDMGRSTGYNCEFSEFKHFWKNLGYCKYTSHQNL